MGGCATKPKVYKSAGATAREAPAPAPEQAKEEAPAPEAGSGADEVKESKPPVVVVSDELLAEEKKKKVEGDHHHEHEHHHHHHHHDHDHDDVIHGGGAAAADDDATIKDVADDEQSKRRSLSKLFKENENGKEGSTQDDEKLPSEPNVIKLAEPTDVEAKVPETQAIDAEPSKSEEADQIPAGELETTATTKVPDEPAVEPKTTPEAIMVLEIQAKALESEAQDARIPETAAIEVEKIGPEEQRKAEELVAEAELKQSREEKGGEVEKIGGEENSKGVVVAEEKTSLDVKPNAEDNAKV